MSISLDGLISDSPTKIDCCSRFKTIFAIISTFSMCALPGGIVLCNGCRATHYVIGHLQVNHIDVLLCLTKDE